MMLNILVSGRDGAEVESLRDAISRCPEFQASGLHLTTGRVDPLHGVTAMPDVLVLCLSASWHDELQALASRPTSIRPPVLVVAPEGDPGVMRLSMQAGARDFLTRPINVDALVESLRQLEQDSISRQAEQNGLTVVMNAKGGSGASMIATNLAHCMAAEGGTSVALVDMDIQFGGLCMYLDLIPDLGLMDAVDNADELDRIALQAYMMKHKSGVEVLGTTHQQVALPGEIDVSRLNRLLDVLSASYSQVVIDLPRQIDLLTTTVLERAGRVVLCMQQSLAHVNDCSRLSGILGEELGVSKDQMIVAVNRYDMKNTVSLADIGQNLPGLQQVTIPNDYRRVTDNIDLGVPLLEQAPKAPISKAIRTLMNKVCGCRDEPRRNLLSRVFGNRHIA